MTFNRNTWATFWMVMAGYMLLAYMYFYMYADMPINAHFLKNNTSIEVALLSILSVLVEAGYLFVTVDDFVNKGKMFGALLSGVIFLSLVAAALVYGAILLYRHITKCKGIDNTSAHIASSVAAIITPTLVAFFYFVFKHN